MGRHLHCRHPRPAIGSPDRPRERLVLSLAFIASATLGCTESAGSGGESDQATPTFVEAVELQLRVCEVGYGCAMSMAKPHELEACALMASVQYDEVGPECVATNYAYWECMLQVYDAHGCAGWNTNNPAEAACSDEADFESVPGGCAPT